MPGSSSWIGLPSPPHLKWPDPSPSSPGDTLGRPSDGAREVIVYAIYSLHRGPGEGQCPYHQAQDVLTLEWDSQHKNSLLLPHKPHPPSSTHPGFHSLISDQKVPCFQQSCLLRTSPASRAQLIPQFSMRTKAFSHTFVHRCRAMPGRARSAPSAPWAEPQASA